MLLFSGVKRSFLWCADLSLIDIKTSFYIVTRSTSSDHIQVEMRMLKVERNSLISFLNQCILLCVYVYVHMCTNGIGLEVCVCAPVHACVCLCVQVWWPCAVRR